MSQSISTAPSPSVYARWKAPTDVDWSKVATVEVRSPPKDLTAHIDVLPASCKAFRIIFNGRPWKENAERRLFFEPLEHKVFEAYCLWAYTGKFVDFEAAKKTLPEAVEKGDFDDFDALAKTLCKTYVFVDRYLDKAAKNAIIIAYHRMAEPSRGIRPGLSIDLVRYMYNNTVQV